MYRANIESLTADLVRELWSQTYNREGKPDWSHIFPSYHEDIIFEDSIQWPRFRSTEIRGEVLEGLWTTT